MMSKAKLSKTQAGVLDIIRRDGTSTMDRSDIAVAFDPSKAKTFLSITGKEFREPGGRAMRLVFDALDALREMDFVRYDNRGRYYLTAGGKKWLTL